MKSFRLNRLFDPVSARCFVVAIDHGIFNEPGFLQGIENLENAVRLLVAANPNAIQLNIGQAHHLQSLPGKAKPALIMRTDLANVYSTTLQALLFSKLADDAAEQAVRLDAAAVIVNLIQLPGHPEVTAQCIDNILRLKPQCDRFCMPLIIEPLVFQPNEKAGGYMVDGDTKKIVTLVRQAIEFGADIIKADPTDRAEDFAKVIETAGRIPVLVRGGGKVSDDVILTRTEALIKQGARGVVYGRNIVQHTNPSAITRALMAVVHENQPAAVAVQGL
jgi:DhnA family fructose-bisphosphate aldolase class Ia